MPLNVRLLRLIPALCLACVSVLLAADENIQPLALGSPAPEFSLPGVDGRAWSLDDFSEAKILVVVFTTNHCPTAQAYEERIKQLVSDYSGSGVAVVAISPNDPGAVRLDELGYTDMGDTYEEMVKRARMHGFNFPYLFDGETQAVSKAYGPQATPHVFIFDSSRKLRYSGRIDNNEKIGAATVHDTRVALDALLGGTEPSVTSTRTFGCSVKWASKSSGVADAFARWAAEPVGLTPADIGKVRELIANPTDKYRLVNIWATWCGPCVVEFPHLVEINRMYRGRPFELVTISADAPDKGEAVLEFLKKQEASNTNFHFSGSDKYELIDAVDSEWSGALPHTLLIAPGGGIAGRWNGQIDPQTVKTAIVEKLGRYYD